MKIRLLIWGIILTWSAPDCFALPDRITSQGSLDASLLLASEQVVADSVTGQQGQSVPKGNPGGGQEGRGASFTIDNGNHKLEFNPEAGKLESLPAIVAADQDFIRAIDYLETRHEVDPQRIGCGGLSLGGEFWMFLAAVEERIQCAFINGFVTIYEALEFRANNCIC